MSELSPEDTKLITLARSARARVGADEGAAVRDGDGRSYTGVTVRQPSFEISALQLAVANAIAAGASTLEAAALITASSEVDPGPVVDLAPVAPVMVLDP
ncbi:MAG TPA: cytidine deaminase [Micromonosporaceae bacterium]|nr:cytidine deaminase [Micromonosporaceae bacterium]